MERVITSATNNIFSQTQHNSYLYLWAFHDANYDLDHSVEILHYNITNYSTQHKLPIIISLPQSTKLTHFAGSL